MNNQQADGLVYMTGTGQEEDISIPSYFVTLNDGKFLKTNRESISAVRLYHEEETTEVSLSVLS